MVNGKNQLSLDCSVWVIHAGNILTFLQVPPGFHFLLFLRQNWIIKTNNCKRALSDCQNECNTSLCLKNAKNVDAYLMATCRNWCMKFHYCYLFRYKCNIVDVCLSCTQVVSVTVACRQATAFPLDFLIILNQNLS